jgi:hypothetical protein
MHRMPLTISQDLDFDMAGFFEVFFKINGIIAESGFGLGAGGLQRIDEIAFIARDFHAATTAASCCFYNDRISNIGGNFQCFI